MTTKAKLVSTIAAFCLVLALMVVGVLAASSATVNLGGSLSFIASDVDATVTVNATGCSETIDGSSPNYSHTFDAGSEESDWTNENIDLTFSDKDTDIVITIKVTNNNEERALKVSFTDSTLPSVTADQNVSMTVRTGDNAAASTAATKGTETIEVGVGEYAIIELTISIDDPNASVKEASASWEAALTLSNVA